ncbi:hypothetical protein BT96DRAFT_203145 [Gymnopus androsaceus JB14]|uniref:Uncharacterized protein n=1 Tax=Gymnopus androsaceus JB14 TaxID=1447944 RepID=A0A6A4ID17_9AGAR|nr:hypothetical protein BT96DRAFT_203145 [Gymnopus androsaceus JB14]
MTPEESALLSLFGSQYYWQISALICTCTFYGIYILAAFIAFYLLIRKGLTGRARKVLFSCLAFVFIMNTWNFVNKCAANLIDIKVALIQDNNGDLAEQLANASGALLHPWLYMINWPGTFNLLISDGIVAWRAWVIWQENIWVKLCLVTVVLANIVVNIVECAFDNEALSSFWDTSRWDSAAAWISFGLNLLATLFIALKAWQHHQAMKALMLDGRRTTAENVLLFFIESGTAYCALQLVYVIFLAITISTTAMTPNVIARELLIEFFTAASALYPVAIVIMVNLDWSPLDQTMLLYESSNTGPTEKTFSSLQFAHDCDTNATGQTNVEAHLKVIQSREEVSKIV